MHVLAIELPMHSRSLRLADDRGRPFDPRVEGVLLRLLPRLTRRFPSISDEAARASVLEEAARRVCARERRGGTLERLDGYAWVTLRSVAASYLRRGESRLVMRAIGGAAGERLLTREPALAHTHRDIERRVLAGQLLASLTPGERRVCLLKHAGYSTREIARALGRSAVSVDTLLCRARAKARRLAAETFGPRRPQSGSRYPAATRRG